MWSIFVNNSSEWKLGGLEYASNVSPADVQTPPPIKIIPALEIYDPPEKNDPIRLKQMTKWYLIIVNIGCKVLKCHLFFISVQLTCGDLDV